MIKHIRMKPKNGLNTSVDSQTCSDEMPSKQETFSYVEKNIFSYIRHSLKWGKYCGDEYFSFVYIFVLSLVYILEKLIIRTVFFWFAVTLIPLVSKISLQASSYF